MSSFPDRCDIGSLSFQASPLLGKTQLVQMMRSSSVGLLLLWAVKKLYAQFMLGYSLVAFCLFTFDKYWQVRWMYK